MTKKYRGKLKSVYGGRGHTRPQIPLAKLNGMTPQQHCEKEIQKSGSGEFKTVSEGEDACMLPFTPFNSGKTFLAPVYSYYYDVCQEIVFTVKINGKVVSSLLNYILKENDRVIIKTNQPVQWEGKYPIQNVDKVVLNDLTYSFTFKKGRVVISAISKCLSSLVNHVGFTQEKVLPCIHLLRQAYPSFGEETSAKPSNDGYDNQCAIRLSVALQKTGIDVKGKYPKTNQTTEGYARSAKGLADWLWQQYGTPRKMSLEQFMEEQPTLKGIFYEHPYDGETAHIDIVDGNQVGSGLYKAKEIWFWALDC